MKWDEIAVKMINAFLDNDSLTSTDLTKLIFEPNDRDEEVNKNNLIISRLKTWIKKGIILNGAIENRIARYRINEDNVKIGNMIIRTDDGEEYDLGSFVTIDIKGEPILVFSLDID